MGGIEISAVWDGLKAVLVASEGPADRLSSGPQL